MNILQIDQSKLSDYATISIAFEVKDKLHVAPVGNGLGGLQLVKIPCTSYVKDYDLLPDCHPKSWPKQFDLETWGLFIAVEDDQYIGAAAVAPEMEGFKGNTSILWDLRVHPNARGRGVGEELIEAVVQWSVERGYGTLLVETQNVNVPACTFYSKMGFVLGTVDAHGYNDPLVEDEVKLLWYRDI
ncbi:GNAT family N-acetyltransferase [Rossellomorea aquimaris]|uniref:GNAT family N-acetyltransferase n=1 Tax=Rossellomorea aquimaris TaxID=189382 RepID=UPI001CD6D045|nr:GNAT family N-acetyltransferase [Rossellomorea aquimaris]MCA1054076.1 GNAT family N-acetyltransferase [Rossellomorea aquimaris]